MRPDISLGLNNFTRKIFPADSADQYFSEEIRSDVKSGAGVKRMGELYGHEKKDSTSGP